MQEAQDSIEAKYQQLQDASFQDTSLTEFHTAPFSSLADGSIDLFSEIPNAQALTNSQNPTKSKFQSYESNSDSLFPLLDSQAVTYQVTNMSHSFEVNFTKVLHVY